MKVLNPYTYVHTPAVPDPTSMTVAGQALTLQELLVRYAKGMPLTDNGMLHYDGDDDPESLDFDEDDDPMLNPALDLVDVEEYRNRLSEKYYASRRNSDIRNDKGESGSPSAGDRDFDESGEGSASSTEAENRGLAENQPL